MLKKFKQRGQAMVFYVLMLPTLFIFVGLVADFGWWFFNQSRLQNAADAAVLAGAYEIAKGCDYPDAEIKVRFVNSPDTSLARHTEIPTFNGDSETVTETAKNYADKNFSYENLKVSNFFQDYAYVNLDEFKTFIKDASSNQAGLLPPLYYVVELRGRANHLFGIMEQFGNMSLHVLAVTRINGKNVPPPLENPGSETIDEGLHNKMPEVVIIGNWEVQNWYYKNSNKWKDTYADIYGHETLFNGKWNHFRTENKTINNSSSKKRTNDRPGVYEENLDVYDGSPDTFATPANGNKKYPYDQLESINLDFTQDFQVYTKSGISYLTEDWDIGYPKNTAEISSISVINGGTLSSRTHSQFSFGAPYKTRPDKEYPDLLGVRVESEPMWSKLGVLTQKTLNSVRQIVININQSNICNEDDEITYRPLVFFYDGPETNSTNPNLTAAERASSKAKSAKTVADSGYIHYENGVKYVNGVPYGENETPYIRDSQPVIINLNAGLSGVFYMPNSPVVLNDNGQDFKGFIVAKKYLALKTEDDFTESGGKYYGSDGKEYFRLVDTVNGFDNVMFVDEKNNVQYKDVSADFKYQYGTFDSFGGKLLEETFFTTDNNYYNFRIPQLSYNLLTYNDQAEEEIEDEDNN